MLIDRGYITTKTSDEEHNYVIRMSNAMHKRTSILSKNFVFLVAYDCNFRCPYCYENGVAKKGRQWSKKVFTKEMVDKAYDAILKIQNKPLTNGNTITLYGGEPLLYHNKEIVEYIVAKGKYLGYNFQAITNGYDLNHFESLLAPDMINKLQITIDGIKEHHNKRRIHYQEENTFDRIIENIGMALKKDIAVSVRVNTDRNNFNDLENLEKSLKCYTDNPKFSIYSALLINYKSNNISEIDESAKNSTNLNFMNKKEFVHKHKSINFKYGCQDYGIFERLSSSIQNNNKLNFNSVFCGAQAGMSIFDPFGEIYGCWNTVGNKEEVLGVYSNGSIEWTDACEKWRKHNVGSSIKCSKCKYVFLCRGGCLSQTLLRNNDVNLPFCDDYPSTYEISINRAYRKYLNK